jgi:hypothetical protein
MKRKGGVERTDVHLGKVVGRDNVDRSISDDASQSKWSVALVGVWCQSGDTSCVSGVAGMLTCRTAAVCDSDWAFPVHVVDRSLPDECEILAMSDYMSRDRE